jgi:hypothetical protein
LSWLIFIDRSLHIKWFNRLIRFKSGLFEGVAHSKIKILFNLL